MLDSANDISSTSGNAKKKALKFVSEGVTDLETQRAREQIEQSKFEAECKRRERKSLREQLRANAINKQKEFNQLVKERDGFNRMSQEELEYFQKLRDAEQKKRDELNLYLNEKTSDFERRKSKLAEAELVPTHSRTRGAKTSLTGVIKKKKHKLKLKKNLP